MKKRTVTIGVTGHRHIAANDKSLSAQVRQHLRSIQSSNEGAEFIILTGLAEGADRLVAKLAMQTIGAKLIAVLAVPEDSFTMDFTSAASKRSFKNYLRKSEKIVTAPLLSKKAWQGYTPARNNQYAWIGAFIAVHSNYLIALWDGKPARGRGGTAEVVRWFKFGRVPKLMLTDVGKISRHAGLQKRRKTHVHELRHIMV